MFKLRFGELLTDSENIVNGVDVYSLQRLFLPGLAETIFSSGSRVTGCTAASGIHIMQTSHLCQGKPGTLRPDPPPRTDTRLAASCSSGPRLQGWALAPGEEGAACTRKSRSSAAPRPACSHTHKCAPRSARAGEQPDTHHAKPAEGVKMTMFSRVTAGTDPLAQSRSAGPPASRPAGQSPVPRAERRREGSCLRSTPGPCARSRALRSVY